jgi:hypothetical protein
MYRMGKVGKSAFPRIEVRFARMKARFARVEVRSVVLMKVRVA